MFQSSIGYGIQFVSELDPGLGMCRFYNLVVDLLQEAPYFFSSRVKSDSDSGVNRAEEKRATWGDPLQNSGYLLHLLKLIPRRPNKLNIKKSSVGEPLAKFWLLSSVALPLFDCLRRPRAAYLIRFM